jgi:hypothetical protein
MEMEGRYIGMFAICQSDPESIMFKNWEILPKTWVKELLWNSRSVFLHGQVGWSGVASTLFRLHGTSHFSTVLRKFTSPYSFTVPAYPFLASEF